MNPLQALNDLAFLVEFAQVDLRQASPSEFLFIGKRVRAFIQTGAPGSDGFVLQSKELEELQRRVFEVLNDAAGPQGFAVAGDLVLSFWGFREGAAIRVRVGGAPVARLLYLAVRLLEAVGAEKLRKCQACDRLFVKVTKKRFCSQRCQSRMYMRELRARERAEAEHFSQKKETRNGKTTRTRRR